MCIRDRELRVSERDVLLMGMLLPLWELSAFPASTVAVGPARTADHKTWLALNVAYPLDHARFGLVVRRKVRDRPTTMMWSLAGGFGLAGVSSTGLAITGVWLKFEGEAIAPGLTGELVLRLALTQKDISGAMAVLADPQAGVPAASSFAVLVADDRGHMALVERTTDVFRGHKPGEPWLAHTNHFLDRGLAKFDLSKKVFPDTFARYRLLTQTLTRRRNVTVGLLKKLMANHEGNPRGICRHEETCKTVAATLLCPNDGTLMVTQGPPCMNKYETFKLSDPAPER